MSFIFYSSFAQVSLSPEQRQDLIEQANKSRALEDYTTTLSHLDKILLANPSDAPILLYKGDVLLQNKQFKEAAKLIKSIIPLKYEPTICKINLSYALFMNHRPKEALKYAEKAWQQDASNQNAIVNYFNALLWNSQTKDAALFYQTYCQGLNQEQKNILLARLSMTKGDFMKGLESYKIVSDSTQNKYYVLENAEVLLGKKEFDAAKELMRINDTLFSENEKRAFKDKYKAATLHRVGTELVYFKDIALNIRKEAAVFWEQGEGRKIRFGIRGGTSQFSVNENNKTNSRMGQIYSHQRFNIKWSGFSEVTFQNINTFDGLTFQAITGQQTIKYQPHDRRMLSLFYSSDILNFTSTLLQKNIRAHNIGGITNILLSAKTGIYSQGSYGFIQDGNQRLQWFGSIYQLIRTEPIVKFGWNVSYLHFKDQDITLYFSPNKYLSTEVFGEFQYKNPRWRNFFFNVQAAAGMQQIEETPWQNAYRLESEIGFNLKHVDLSLKYRESNAAFQTGAGYQFNWFIARLVYKW